MKKKLLIGAALILSVGMACTSGAGDWQSYSGDKTDRRACRFCTCLDDT